MTYLGSQNRYPTPLRYPGGKQRLAPFFERLITLNALKECTYIEPFAGGGGVGLHLLESGAVSRIHLNDLDRSIYAFWYSATRRTEALCRLISKCRVSVAEWDRQKEVQKKKEHASLLELGFSTLFLNRTNVSGILTGGIIGGRKQRGHWKIGARFDKVRVQHRIRRVGSLAQKISISNTDVRENRGLSFGHSGERLVYLDPPYFRKGRDLYLNHFEEPDHARLARQVLRLDRPNWVVTYDNTPEALDLYPGARRRFFDLPHTASVRTVGREAMFLAPSLRIPRRVSPY